MKCVFGECALHLTGTDCQKIRYDSNSGLLFSVSTRARNSVLGKMCSHLKQAVPVSIQQVFLQPIESCTDRLKTDSLSVL